MHPATGPGGEAQGRGDVPRDRQRRRIGITRIEDGYGLKVNLERLPASPLPTDVDGVPLRVEIVGSIRKREVTEGR